MSNEVEYLKGIVAPLMAHPESVKVERSNDERGVLLQLDVHTEDMGRVIGKHGETAKALRRLLRQYGMANEMRISMRVTEPPDGKRNRQDDLGDPTEGFAV